MSDERKTGYITEEERHKLLKEKLAPEVYDETMSHAKEAEAKYIKKKKELNTEVTITSMLNGLLCKLFDINVDISKIEKTFGEILGDYNDLHKKKTNS